VSVCIRACQIARRVIHATDSCVRHLNRSLSRAKLFTTVVRFVQTGRYVLQQLRAARHRGFFPATNAESQTQPIASLDTQRAPSFAACCFSLCRAGLGWRGLLRSG